MLLVQYFCFLSPLPLTVLGNPTTLIDIFLFLTAHISFTFVPFAGDYLNMFLVLHVIY